MRLQKMMTQFWWLRRSLTLASGGFLNMHWWNEGQMSWWVRQSNVPLMMDGCIKTTLCHCSACASSASYSTWSHTYVLALSYVPAFLSCALFDTFLQTHCPRRWRGYCVRVLWWWHCEVEAPSERWCGWKMQEMIERGERCMCWGKGARDVAGLWGWGCLGESVRGE